MSKRKLDAGGVNLAPEAPQHEGLGMGGTALNIPKQRQVDTQESLAQGVLSQALELEPGQICGSARSGRVGDRKNDAYFRPLVAKIKRRERVQPMRVHRRARNWKRQHDHPLISRDRFFFRPGRGRPAGCKDLGIKVNAVNATEERDRTLADLKERFHRNTVRKNLLGFEELLSFGLFSDALGDSTQFEIAERLGIPLGDVSSGPSCMKLHDRTASERYIRNIPKREFHTIITRLQRGGAKRQRRMRRCR